MSMVRDSVGDRHDPGREPTERSVYAVASVSYGAAAGCLVVMNVAYRPAPGQSADDI